MNWKNVHLNISRTKYGGEHTKYTLQEYIFETAWQEIIYRKVASSSTSRLVARPRIFWLLMKGKFDPYVLWPLAWDLWPCEKNKKNVGHHLCTFPNSVRRFLLTYWELTNFFTMQKINFPNVNCFSKSPFPENTSLTIKANILFSGYKRKHIVVYLQEIPRYVK